MHRTLGWLSQLSVLTFGFGSGHDLGVVRSSPTFGLYTLCRVCLGSFPSSSPAPLPCPLHAFFLLLSIKRKKKIKLKYIQKLWKSLHLFLLLFPPSPWGAAVVTAWGVCPCLLYMPLLPCALLYLKPPATSCSSDCSAASFSSLSQTSPRTFPARHTQIHLNISMGLVEYSIVWMPDNLFNCSLQVNT